MEAYILAVREHSGTNIWVKIAVDHYMHMEARYARQPPQEYLVEEYPVNTTQTSIVPQSSPAEE